MRKLPSQVLLCLDSDDQPSVFDSVVALDADVAHLLRHGAVKPANVRDLVYGLMFTRGQEDLRHSAIFIGGSDVQVGEVLLKEAVDAFFGSVRVSVMLDANGCNTTAAAAVIAARRHVALAGSLATVLAATGSVGRRVVRLLAGEGVRVRVASRKGVHAEGVCDRIAAQVENAELTPLTTDTVTAMEAAVEGAQIVIACGPPGVELMSASLLAGESMLRVAVDLNAVPPVGLGGIAPTARGELRDGHACYGALGVGADKMKIHRRAIVRLFEQNDLVLDAEQIYAIGKDLLAT